MWEANWAKQSVTAIFYWVSIMIIFESLWKMVIFQRIALFNRYDVENASTWWILKYECILFFSVNIVMWHLSNKTSLNKNTAIFNILMFIALFEFVSHTPRLLVSLVHVRQWYQVAEWTFLTTVIYGGFSIWITSADNNKTTLSFNINIVVFPTILSWWRYL